MHNQSYVFAQLASHLNRSKFYRFHCAGAFFVVRAKKNLQYKVVKWKRRMPKNVLSDSIIKLTTYKSRNDYPEQLRRVEYYDEAQDRRFVFLTNAMNTPL